MAEGAADAPRVDGRQGGAGSRRGPGRHRGVPRQGGHRRSPPAPRQAQGSGGGRQGDAGGRPALLPGGPRQPRAVELPARGRRGHRARDSERQVHGRHRPGSARTRPHGRAAAAAGPEPEVDRGRRVDAADAPPRRRRGRRPRRTPQGPQAPRRRHQPLGAAAPEAEVRGRGERGRDRGARTGSAGRVPQGAPGRGGVGLRQGGGRHRLARHGRRSGERAPGRARLASAGRLARPRRRRGAPLG